MMPDTSAILTQNLPQPQNPLNTLTTLQQLQLQQAQTANTRQQTQNLITTNDQGQQTLAVNRMNRQAQVAYGLSNMTDDQLKGGAPIRSALDAELAAGTIDQNTHDVALANLPPATQADGTPTPGATYRPILNSHMVAALTPAQAVQAVTGSPVQVDNGQTIQGAQQGGALGQHPGVLLGPNGQPLQTPSGAPGIQKVTPPETNANLVKVWNPATQQNDFVPRSSLPGASGATTPPPGPSVIWNPATKRFDPVTASNSTTPATGIPGTGGYAAPASPPPSQGAGVGGTGPQAAVQPPASPPPAIQAEPPMGTAETIGANQKQYQADIADIPEGQQRIANLQEAHRALAALQTNAPGSVGGGVDPEKIQHWKQVMLQLGMGNEDTMKNVTDYATANKYFANNAVSLPSARSDASLATTLAGQPSVHIPPDAALDLTKQIVGRERQRIAQVMDAPDPTGKGYQYHSATFANENDRRAFAYDMYTPAEQQALLDSIKKQGPAAYAKFEHSIGVAARLHLINPPAPQAVPPAQATPTQSAPPPAQTAPVAPAINPPAQAPNPLVYPRGA